jgi:predicted HTH transcriptional regulator
MAKIYLDGILSLDQKRKDEILTNLDLTNPELAIEIRKAIANQTQDEIQIRESASSVLESKIITYLQSKNGYCSKRDLRHYLNFTRIGSRADDALARLIDGHKVIQTGSGKPGDPFMVGLLE